MSGEIKRGGKLVWPAWDYIVNDDSLEAVTAQLLESIRNVLEDIARSQVLQCDVRRDIREIRLALQRRRRKPKAKAKRRRP